MSVSLEVRALHVSDTAKDLIITSAHLPEGCRIDHEIFLTRSLNVPPGHIVRRSDISAFWKSLPEPIQTDFQRQPRPWLESDVSFLERAIKMQMLGSFQHATIPSADFFKGIPFPHDPLSRVMDWHYRQLRNGQSAEGRGMARVHFLASVLLHLDGFFVSEADVSWSDAIASAIRDRSEGSGLALTHFA
jgi:hypothetical protein